MTRVQSAVPLATIRAAIYATLAAAIADQAQVWDTFRDAKTEKQLQDFYHKSGKFHVWMITLAPTNPFQTTNAFWNAGRGANQEFGQTSWHIHGYYGANDSTTAEKTFQDLVELVVDWFRGDKKLGGHVITSGPLQVVEGMGAEGMRMFPAGEGGTLCCYAKCELTVRVEMEN